MNRKLLFIAGILSLFTYVLIIFSPIFLQNKVPVPADTIVGLYHPFRDWQAPSYPNGIPFKNPLVTDPVRQQYVWRELAVSNIQKKASVSWNPYSLSGTSLAGNPQTAVFYPLNLVYFLTNFVSGWTIQIIAQVVIGMVLMYLFLKRHVEREAALLGSLAWIGSGFFVAWSTLNTLTQAAIWLPLALYSCEKIVDKKSIYILTLALSLSLSFLAGAWQIFLYLSFFIAIYAVFHSWSKKNFSRLPHIIFGFIAAGVLVLPQLIPSLNYFANTSRSIDTLQSLPEGWFLPPKHLVQFLIPDYFGNPATGNYFGDWNYMEFIGFIGVTPFVLAIVAIIMRPKHSTFWVVLILVSLLTALPNPFVTFYAQPTRILVIVCFCLATLSAFGLDLILKGQLVTRKLLVLLAIVAILMGASVSIAVFFNWPVSVKNSILPMAIFTITGGLLLFAKKRFLLVAVIGLFAVTVLDLGRFHSKFTPFSDKSWLFPETKVTSFLKENLKNRNYRFQAVDDRILPANFSIHYKIPTISGYDSAIPTKVSGLVVAMERGNPNVNAPWGFNRIVSPKNINSPLFPLFGVKYVLSMDEITSPMLKLVLTEGVTKVYENQDPLPIVRSVLSLKCYPKENQVLDALFEKDISFKNSAFCYGNYNEKTFAQLEITKLVYKENGVSFETTGSGNGFIVFSESNFTGWQVRIDGVTKKILPVNYAFMGVEVPMGTHTVSWLFEN